MYKVDHFAYDGVANSEHTIRNSRGNSLELVLQDDIIIVAMCMCGIGFTV